jgi:hypothetical protein
MPLIDEIKNTLLFVAEMSEEEQLDIAEYLSRRVVAKDYADTMSHDEIEQLMMLAFDDMVRTLEQLRQAPTRQRSKPSGWQR